MKDVKRPEKQHTVGAIALGTIVGAAITAAIMPEVIDKVVDKMNNFADKIAASDFWDKIYTDAEAETAEDLVADMEEVYADCEEADYVASDIVEEVDAVCDAAADCVKDAVEE